MAESANQARSALLLHGAGGGAWEWALWRGVFAAQGWRVQAPEFQPAGDGLQRTGLADYLDQARAARGAAGAEAVLIGASLGGLIALQLAAEAPPSALVLINPLPPAPWHALLPARAWPARVPWGRERSLSGTRRSLFDADEATCLAAFRLWRDESGRVLREACAGLALALPACPALVQVSLDDADVPPAASLALAEALGADLLRLPATSHVGPLLGRHATRCAAQAVEWLNARCGLRADSPRRP